MKEIQSYLLQMCSQIITQDHSEQLQKLYKAPDFCALSLQAFICIFNDYGWREYEFLKTDIPIDTSKEVSTFLEKNKPLQRGERNVIRNVLRFKKLFLTCFLRNQK